MLWFCDISMPTWLHNCFQVSVTEVLGGGKFYVQIVGDRRLASIQQQVALMEFRDSSKTFISQSTSNTALDTLKDQDQENNPSSDTLEVKDNPKDNAVSLPSRWSLLFKDQLRSSKDEVPFDNPEDEAPIQTFEANDHSDAAPFKPVKGDVVLAQFSLDNSWNRALVWWKTIF